MGLASWRSAYRRLLATGADVILCGHDHQEGAGQIEGALAVSTSGTHSFRTRGGRPSVFNLVTVDDRAVHIQHFRWESTDRRFLPSDAFSFARAGAPQGGGLGGRRRPGAVSSLPELPRPTGSACSAFATSPGSSPTPTAP